MSVLEGRNGPGLEAVRGLKDPIETSAVSYLSRPFQAQKALQPYQVGWSPPSSRVYTAQLAYFMRTLSLCHLHRDFLRRISS